jgi:hypothetical protein
MRTRTGLMFGLALIAGPAGCAHSSLERNTVRKASTTTDITYQMILSNLAMFSLNPDTLPWHVRVEEGTVQIGDEVGFGQEGGFTFGGGNGGFGFSGFGPLASRSVTMQWGTDAVLDPVRLTDLQNLYRRALGAPPLPDTTFIANARAKQLERAGRERKEDEGNGKGQERPEPKKEIKTVAAEEADGRQPDSPARRETPDRPGLDFEVPVGWFHVGSKRDVPKDACYVGCYGDRYVWVMPEGVLGLNRFTLAVLTIVQLDPDERVPRRGAGLAVTR